jgi:hypothetical protein
MQLSPTRKKRLAAAASLVSVSFLVYMLGPSDPVGPPYRDENLTGGPEPLMLVRQPSVREELKLTEAQVKQIQEAVEKQSGGMRPPNGKDAMTAPRAARMGRKHQEAFLARVLRPEQAARLRQIILQRQGGFALNSSQTAADLALTELQRQKADGIIEKFTGQQNQSRNARGPEARKQAEEARTAAGEDLLALLTPEQQDRWKELTGEPFAGEINFGPPRGGPPGGGPGGGPGGRPGRGPGGPPPGGKGPDPGAAPPTP